MITHKADTATQYPEAVALTRTFFEKNYGQVKSTWRLALRLHLRILSIIDS